ncbi:MAG: sigma factor [Acidobacteriaceae bacterium]|nr:sigma factor [Acidobacteriaceae bacterium]
MDKTLNNLYSAWAANPNDVTMHALLSSVRSAALKSFRFEFRDSSEDMSQNVVFRVWERLPTFTPQDEGSFARWVSVIIRNERRQQWDRPKLNQVDVLEQPQEEHHYFDTSFLPDSIQPAAKLLLAGFSFKEAAELLQVNVTALRERFRRFRQEYSVDDCCFSV